MKLLACKKFVPFLAHPVVYLVIVIPCGWWRSVHILKTCNV